MEGSREVKITKVQEMRSYMKSVNSIFIVLEKGGITVTKGDHTISHALVADNTASINLSLWDTQGEQVKAGDIIRLTGGYCSLFKNSLVLYSGTHGALERIGQYNMVFSEFPNMSSLQWVTDPNNPKNMTPISPKLRPDGSAPHGHHPPHQTS